METKILKESLKKVEMPEEMQKRILRNCQLEMEDRKYMKQKTIKERRHFTRRPVTVAASLVVCLFLAGVTVSAASGSLQGFFKDIFRWDGAVVGTSYEQATEELKVEITEVKDVLTVRVEMLYPEQAPYGFMETFGISQYKIVDADGKAVVKNANTEMTELAGDTVLFEIPVEKCTGGKYQLVIESFVGGSKADQPLEIHGTWSCEFVR